MVLFWSYLFYCVFNKSHLLSRLINLWALTVRLYSHPPTREFLSGICNILHQLELSHSNNNNQNGVCYFDMKRGCSNGFKTFGRTAVYSIAFHILKELSNSNGSCEALQWLPPKGGRLCRPLPRRGGRASVSAALEDTTVALFAASTLAISETSNPSTTLWTMLVSICCQAPLSPQYGDYRHRQGGTMELKDAFLPPCWAMPVT